jgi:siroheme synthase-like protein
MRTLPVNFNMERGCCLVVGGGEIALQKVRVLVGAGARVRVVAPFAMRALDGLAGVSVLRRPFEEGDLEGVTLAIAATDDAALNHRIYDLGRARGLPVNCVDDPAYCDFIFPSILRRGELAVSVSTGGGSPALARLLRHWLETQFDEGFGDALALVEAMRRETRSRIGCPGARRAVNECLARMALNARRATPADLRRRMEDVVAAVEAEAPITVRIEPAVIAAGAESMKTER